jgi:hypothetical protein
MTYTIKYDSNKGCFVYSFNYIHSLKHKKECLYHSKLLGHYVFVTLN